MEKNQINLKKAQSGAALLGLVMVFIAVLVVNQKPSTLESADSVGEGKRTIASAQGMNSQGTMEKGWQRELAREVAKVNLATEGKGTHPTSSLERFLFEELRGQYVMGMSGDKIKAMTWKKTENEPQLKYFGQELALLEKHRDLWWIGFESVGLKSRIEKETLIELYDQQKKLVGEARFEWDPSGRMLSLALEKF